MKKQLVTIVDQEHNLTVILKLTEQGTEVIVVCEQEARSLWFKKPVEEETPA